MIILILTLSKGIQPGGRRVQLWLMAQCAGPCVFNVNSYLMREFMICCGIDSDIVGKMLRGFSKSSTETLILPLTKKFKHIA